MLSNFKPVGRRARAKDARVRRSGRMVIATILATVLLQTWAEAQRGRGAGPPPTPRGAAPVDLTGQWVSLITEDWRYRQFTAAKGDYAPLPPLLPPARSIADRWDPAADEAAGEQCRAFGAAGVMRLPTRVRITWQDDSLLRLETDAGTQTRLLRFGPPQGQGGDWQGVSVASWDYPRASLAGRGGPAPGGSLKVVTSRMKPGYLRRNGVPYSANAVMTEYFHRFGEAGAESLLVVATEIVDPEYLATPYWTSVQFKRETDASRWHPTPCRAR